MELWKNVSNNIVQHLSVCENYRKCVSCGGIFCFLISFFLPYLPFNMIIIYYRFMLNNVVLILIYIIYLVYTLTKSLGYGGLL